ncbi:MAG TPA: sensor domain-containing protein, partial [Ilumatobacteraceae bacterium]|nr:sensor domain-containing protein [Ilumatobacteraceae bacterium]
MNTTTIPLPATHPSLARRFLDVVARPRSYRNIAYLLLGLPLGTLWFSVLVTVASVSVSMLVVALLGIPMLIGMWYAVRAFANVERAVASTLLDAHIEQAPMAAGVSGNLWVRFKAMSSDRSRWRELGYLLLRFPAGIATFTLAVAALTTPVFVAYAPIYARYVDDSDDAFGDWFWGTELHDFANANPWSWALIPAGVALLFAALHALNAVARGCGRWARAWLGGEALTR